MGFRRFAFEESINDTLELMPLDVRRKLDLSGRRLSLTVWRQLPESVRRDLAECDDAEFALLVERVAPGADRMAPSAGWRNAGAVAAVAAGARAAGLRFEVDVWNRLDDAARYALWRL